MLEHYHYKCGCTGYSKKCVIHKEYPIPLWLRVQSLEVKLAILEEKFERHIDDSK